MSIDRDSLEARLALLMPINKLPGERQQRLLLQSEVLKLHRKQTVFNQGDRDDYSYYLIEGGLEMYADDALIKKVSGGDGASFQPLAQLQPQQMTAIVKSKKISLLRVQRSLLKQLMSMDEQPSSSDAVGGVEVEEVESLASGD